MAHLFNKRYYSVRIDPIFACNLRCLMCYFSGGKKSSPKKFTKEELDQLSKSLFGNALQVVVGCGAEPTLHPDFIHLVKLAKMNRVPHIGLVSNGQRIDRATLVKLSEAGLTELIISLHGITKASYEHFMVGAKWDKTIALLETIRTLKKHSQIDYSIRINYTTNPKNIEELELFFKVLEKYPIDVLQVRPIMDIGGIYNEHFTQETIGTYNQVIKKIKLDAKRRDITLVANTQNPNYKGAKPNPILSETYKYASPHFVVANDFNFKTTTYRKYLKGKGWYKLMLNKILLPWEKLESSDFAERYSSQYNIW